MVIGGLPRDGGLSASLGAAAAPHRDRRRRGGDSHRAVVRAVEKRAGETRGAGSKHAAPLTFTNPQPIAHMTLLNILVALAVEPPTHCTSRRRRSPYTVQSRGLELGGALTVPRGAATRTRSSPSSLPARVPPIATATRCWVSTELTRSSRGGSPSAVSPLAPLR